MHLGPKQLEKADLGAARAGAEDEFIFVGRLDNLAMSFCSLQVRRLNTCVLAAAPSSL